MLMAKVGKQIPSAIIFLERYFLIKHLVLEDTVINNTKLAVTAGRSKFAFTIGFDIYCDFL